MNTQVKIIRGCRGGKDTDYIPENRELTVKFTHSPDGESISIEDGERMLQVPFEPVAKMIEKARKAK